MGSLKLSLGKPLVLFVTGDPALSLRQPGWQLQWRVKIAGWNEVTLSNGLKLSEMPGSLILRCRTKDTADKADKETKKGVVTATESIIDLLRGGTEIGALHYIPAYEGSSDGVVKAEPDAYSVEVMVDEAELRTLIDKVQAGLGPESVNVSVPGLDAGNLPDFSYQKWAIDSKEWLAVDGLIFWFGNLRDDEEMDEDESLGTPESAPVSPELSAIRELTQLLRNGAPWLFGLLIAIVVAVFLRG